MNKTEAKKWIDQINGLLLGFAGALWGLTALGMATFGPETYNPVVVAADLAGLESLEQVFYGVLGLAGLYQVYFLYRLCDEIDYS